MFIELDRNSRIPLNNQLYDAITTRILKGELVAGKRLPSTRELADRLGIARNTVIEIMNNWLQKPILRHTTGKGLLSPRDMTGLLLMMLSLQWKKAASASAGTVVT